MTTFEEKGKAFWDWLVANGATISDKIAFKDYRSENSGRGVIATQDIKEGDVLFSLPRSILLSQVTSSLKDKVSELSELPGWAPLILCMMYEIDKPESFWKPYFDVLPREFSTPMFWNQDDLKELEGTDIDSDDLFHNELEPIIKKHPELFDEKKHNLELFHICGSLVMAYSFLDEMQKLPKKKTQEEEQEDEEDDDDDDDEEGLITMVPMADMLNHKAGFNNARLFHEPDCLQMKAIKNIKEGEQIYNTYGDLCNADLLRKYGFVDEKNDFDLVELDGLLVVDVCCEGQDEALKEKKIEFLMEEGALDDTKDEFKMMEEKQKLPKPKLTKEAKEKIETILKKRLERYPTSLEDDELMLTQVKDNKKNALIVRIGEKKIIKETLANVEKTPIAVEKRPAPQKVDKQSKKQKK
ncbi:RuBisCO-cytochrome methylase [Rhizopus microsporus ATCC 52813]|uniref:N-lysine methyltransferase SETD6 n=1 Tax=Rhizopus microsporus ATCC 52813 TaxID=1340429 RepID=A0A2G4T7Y2_RHIZD|nr:RuBisCO-cytochrome methylase [Rhizopus microsporus ATCC 52813]PHZ17134.1 RuBisCO-cytochrome methylase [Rhizopus microsporus ATCC 52813]